MEKSTPETQTVSVKVLPALKAYILAVNEESDVIVPCRESRLWGLVKTHLDLVPPDYKPTPAAGTADTIRIAVYTIHRMNYNHPKRKTIVVDSLWRSNLSEEGQRVVADYLMRFFKQSYRSYMVGALANNPKLKIHDAILNFCTLHKINMDIVTYEMLRKDWFRFRLRHPDGYVIPIENKDF